jgi:uncharacterized membrane protein
MLSLCGLAVVVLGFAVGVNPLLVVVAAAFVSGLAAHLSPLQVLAALGRSFNDARLVTAALLVLPLVGVLERAGIQEQSRRLIARFRGATAGRLLILYMLFRQLTAAIGLVSIAGQPQTVRPLLAPMAETAAQAQAPELDEAGRQKVRAFAAATDNVAVFFGEDIFLAIGSILLITAQLAAAGVHVEPLRLSLWAIPSAIAAFVVHAVRLLRLDARLRRGGREVGR